MNEPRNSEAHAELEDAILRLAEGARRLCDEQPEGGEPEPGLLNAVFRDAHSLKGLSGLFGEPTLASLAHAAEDLLDGLRLGRIGLADEVEDLLLELPVALDSWLETGREGDLAAKIRQVLDAQLARSEAAAPVVPTGLSDVLTSYEEHRVAQVLLEGEGLYALRAELPLATFDVGLRRLREDAAALGEILATLPVAEQPNPNGVVCDLLLGSLRSQGELATALGWERTVRTLSAVKPVRSERPVVSTPQRSVRIDIRRLDRMMDVLDDLHLAQRNLGRIVDRLREAQAPEPLVEQLQREIARFEAPLEALQREGLEVRMVPLSPLFTRTRQLADRLARELGKEVEVRLEGGEVQVDKVLAEALAKPLVHLVHNALDHGIELPDARVAAGKPRCGVLRLSASQRGGTVILEVNDDGAGIDPDRVRKAAEARGLIGFEGPELAQNDIVRLLLTPGFSTASGVSSVSGRGVGLAAVRDQVVSFAGFLEVESELGQGTTFTVALPATLAMLRGIIVRAGGRRYALPASVVWEMAVLGPDAGRRYQRPETGAIIRLVPLAELFQLSSSSGGETSSSRVAAIVGPPERRVGLILDAVEGTRDLVMKPLGGLLGAIPGVAGLARLEPDEPVLVLDVAALTDEALGRPALRRLT